MMGNRIHTTRLAERFSSHTLAQTASSHRPSEKPTTVRQKLIDATVEVVAEGGDPRLGRTRALALSRIRTRVLSGLPTVIPQPRP
jgi:hypothetical protein